MYAIEAFMKQDKSGRKDLVIITAVMTLILALIVLLLNLDDRSASAEVIDPERVAFTVVMPADVQPRFDSTRIWFA